MSLLFVNDGGNVLTQEPNAVVPSERTQASNFEMHGRFVPKQSRLRRERGHSRKNDRLIQNSDPPRLNDDVVFFSPSPPLVEIRCRRVRRVNINLKQSMEHLQRPAAAAQHPKESPTQQQQNTLTVGIRSRMTTSSLNDTNLLAEYSREIRLSYNSSIFLGSYQASKSWKALRDANVTGIVNITTHVPNSFPNHFEYYNLRLPDWPDAPLWQYLDEVTAFLHRHLAVNGGNVLVHCCRGTSRSVAVVWAYLLRYHRATATDRALIVLDKVNPGLLAQVQQWHAATTTTEEEEEEEDAPLSCYTPNAAPNNIATSPAVVLS